MTAAIHMSAATSLEGISKTLLITLCARALARHEPELKFKDQHAEELVHRLALDTKGYASDRLSMLGSVLRAKVMDDRARQFFLRHPDGLGISIGAGLCTRFQRIDNGRMAWLDVDLPPVISLRRELLGHVPRSDAVGASLSDQMWLQRAAAFERKPWFIAAEGVLMFLEREDVEKFFQNIAEIAPAGSEVLFDYASARTVRLLRTVSLRASRTPLRWGLKRPGDLSALHPRLLLRDAPIRFSAPERFPELRLYGLVEKALFPILRGPITALASVGIS